MRTICAALAVLTALVVTVPSVAHAFLGTVIRESYSQSG